MWLCLYKSGTYSGNRSDAVIPPGSSSGTAASSSAETWPCPSAKAETSSTQSVKSGHPINPFGFCCSTGSALGKGTGLSKECGLHPTVQFCFSSARTEALTPASFLWALMQSRAHTQMPLSYFLADPLTWFPGSLNTWVIKHCFISGTKPKVYEILQIIIHLFFSPTHSLFIFQVCLFLQACSAWKIMHFCKFGQDLGLQIMPSAISWAGVLHR